MPVQKDRSAETAGGLPELWGGVECSVVRLHDTWRDQVRETGHQNRPDDLDRIAALGIRTLRYPLLWERTQRDEDWAWHDRRMGHAHRLGIRIVAGLVHHGSGPSGTSLLDPEFPEKLARYADVVAARYPDVLDWTPVNEPLTTARFGCLYGLWYPHARDLDSMLRAVAIQCRAVLLAMRAIRRRIPGARLIQTEDIGRTFSTEMLREQARHENERRWLSLDLLGGRVTSRHPWRQALEAAGVSASDLDELATGEATPDVIGANYYVTSERFLDHRTALYPSRTRGGNGRTAYVDTEAARVDLPQHLTGWNVRLGQLWARYSLPLAVTEAHLACVDEAEQARWFMEAWDAAVALRSEGAIVEAVTAWALLGAVDWDSLLTKRNRSAEHGAWDFSTGRPRMLSEVLQFLAAGKRPDLPALRDAGWWRREDRLDTRRTA